jgi:putative peptide zinc metalloprotease protein
MTTFSQLDPDPSPDESARYWKLADGVELLGEFDGPAFEQRPGLVRRRDGQVLQISPLLYALAESLDGTSNATLLAQLVSTRVGRELSAENVDYLVEHRLGPLGLIGRDAESAGPTRMSEHRSKPLLALRFRSRLVPERAHRLVTLALRPLFHPLVITAVLGLLVTLDVAAVETRHIGVAAATLQLASHPALLLLVTALLFASAAFHEIGHATAARYGGATPGVMGVGIYLVWPVFYTDLSDVYRLGRRSRIRADLGGVYFNAVLITIADGAFLSTRYAPLLVFIVLAHVQLLYQFMPFVRMDGYWILSDLVGVPNLFAYIRPVLASMRGAHDPRYAVRLARIRPWARRVISGWVIFTIAILGVNAAIIVLTGPRILTTDLVACHSRATALVGAFERANVLGGINDLVAFILLAVPGAGILLIAWLLTRRAARLIVSWWPLHRTRATALGLVSLAALGTFAFKFVPNDIARPLMGRTGGSFFAYQSPALALPGSPSAGDRPAPSLTTSPRSNQVALRGLSTDRPRPTRHRSETGPSTDHAPIGRTPSQAAPPSSTVPINGAPVAGTGATQTGSPTGDAPTGDAPTGDAPTGDAPTPPPSTGATGAVPSAGPAGVFALAVTTSTTIPEMISAGVSTLLPTVGGSVSPTGVAPVSVNVSATISAALPPQTTSTTDAATASTTAILPATTPTSVVASTSATLSTGVGRGASAEPDPAGVDLSTTVSATTSRAGGGDPSTSGSSTSVNVSTTVAAQLPTNSKSADEATNTPTASVEASATISKTLSASVSATTSSAPGSTSRLGLSL